MFANRPTNDRKRWYLDSSTADVHFSFDSSITRVPAHKVLLAIESDVFKAMFYGGLKETGDIRVTDASDAAFKMFLQFFYLNEVALSFEHIVEVMNLGHKYMVTNCIDICAAFLENSHTAENIFTILHLAILYDRSELLKSCMDFVILNTMDVLNSAGFLKCDRQTLVHILNANLFVCSEIELFEACMAWVKAKSDQSILSKNTVDEHLGNLFYDFRFGTMTIQEFCKLARKYDAVLRTDFQNITELIVMPQFQRSEFNTGPRKINWNNDDATVTVSPQRISFGKAIKASPVEWIKFSANKPLLLIGFACGQLESLSKFADDDDHIPSTDNASKRSCIAVQVNLRGEARDVNAAYDKDLMKTLAKFQLGHSTDVTLPRPILIKPGLYYQISIRYPYEYTYYTTELPRLVHLDAKNTIVFQGGKGSIESATIVGLFSAIEFNRI